MQTEKGVIEQDKDAFEKQKYSQNGSYQAFLIMKKLYLQSKFYVVNEDGLLAIVWDLNFNMLWSKFFCFEF